MPRVLPSVVVNLIDRFFPWVQSVGPSATTSVTIINAPQISSIVKLSFMIPDDLPVLDTATYGAFLAALGSFQSAVEICNSRPSGTAVEPIPGIGNALKVIRDALTRCPDESPPPDTAQLDFLEDQDLRRSLRTDIGTVSHALSTGDWKAATVFSGAVIEALLLWVLGRQSGSVVQQSVDELVATGRLRKQPGNDLNEWSLHPLVEVATALNLIQKTTAIEARLVKDFRNLIHPGRVLRLGQTCDRGTAHLAYATLDHVVRDLRRLPRR